MVLAERFGVTATRIWPHVGGGATVDPEVSRVPAASISVEVVIVVRPEWLDGGLAQLLRSPGVPENVFLLGVLVELEHPVREDH